MKNIYVVLHYKADGQAPNTQLSAIGAEQAG